MLPAKVKRRQGNAMDLGQLLNRMTKAAEAKDGKGFAACFTPDGVYRDYIYGDHTGREQIADMLENYFHRDATDYRWQFFEPVCDGKLGYAWSLSSFTSTIPEFRGNKIVIDGASRFRLKDGLIEEYWESVNGGVAMAQLGVQPERVLKVLKRWAENLKNQPTTIAYLKAK
jgi:ketosteroid isomerase-like protein